MSRRAFIKNTGVAAVAGSASLLSPAAFAQADTVR